MSAIMQKIVPTLLVSLSLIFCKHKSSQNHDETIKSNQEPAVVINDSLSLILKESDSQKEPDYVRMMNTDDQTSHQNLLDQFQIDPFIIDEMDQHQFSAALLFPDLSLIDVRTKQPVRSGCPYVIYDLVSGFLFTFSSPEQGFQYFSESHIPINSPFSGILCTSGHGEVTEFRSEGKLAIPYESLWFFEHQFMLSRGFQKKEPVSGLNLNPPDKEDVASLAAILIGAGLGHIVAVKHLDDLLLDKLLPGHKRTTPDIPANSTKHPSPSESLKKQSVSPEPTSIKTRKLPDPSTSLNRVHRGGSPFSAVNGGTFGQVPDSRVPYFLKQSGLEIGTPKLPVPDSLNGHPVFRASTPSFDLVPPKHIKSGYRVESNPVSGVSRLWEVRQKNPITPKEHVVVYKSLAEDKLNNFHIVTNDSGRALISQGMEGTCNPSSCLNAISSVDSGLSASEINQAFRLLTSFDYQKMAPIKSVVMKHGKPVTINHVLKANQKGYSNGRYLAEAFNKHIKKTNPKLRRFTLEAEDIPPYQGHLTEGQNRWYANALLKQFESSGGKPMIISTKVNKSGSWSGHAVTLENIEKIGSEIWMKGINSWGIEFTVRVTDNMVFPGFQKVIDLGSEGTRTITSQAVPFRLDDHFVKIQF